jgi:hypothetical protein
MISNDYLEYLGEFESILVKTAEVRGSGSYRGVVDEKKTKPENLMTLPL